MKPYDILAIGELNVDLILNNIDGEPEVGKEKFAGDMIQNQIDIQLPDSQNIVRFHSR